VTRSGALQSVLILSTLLTLGCDSWRTYRVPLKPGEQLDQEVAIRLSTEVIHRAGYQPDDFELFPIRKKGEGGLTENPYFGTAPVYPSHGYVMWKSKRPNSVPSGLTVSMEVEDRIAVCKLSRWH
jgi:hypothetical protein